jgi:hypothetical protein
LRGSKEGKVGGKEGSAAIRCAQLVRPAICYIVQFESLVRLAEHSEWLNFRKLSYACSNCEHYSTYEADCSSCVSMHVQDVAMLDTQTYL